MVIPGEQDDFEFAEPQKEPPTGSQHWANQELKFCVHCGNKIARAAIICPKCGVGQPGTLPPGFSEPAGPRSAIKVCLIVAGCGNILAAALWASTCILGFMAIPPIILALYELITASGMDRYSDLTLRRKVHFLSIFEIIFGVLTLSLIAFVCGILNMVNSGKLRQL